MRSVAMTTLTNALLRSTCVQQIPLRSARRNVKQGYITSKWIHLNRRANGFFFRTKHVYQLHITVSGFPWKSLNAWRRRACARGCRAGKLPFNEIRLWWLMCVCDTPGGVFIPSRGFRWVCVWAWVGGCLLFRANLIIHFMRICK